ncbi:hypothetical protein [Nocardioides jensenii]|nr:hypothetical protein [Nocardioides jensenii]
MRSQNQNDRPAMTWIEVKDATGRTHLEARWSVTTHSPAATVHAA